MKKAANAISVECDLLCCVILQTTVVHREPATALPAAQWPGLWGIYKRHFQLSVKFHSSGVIALCRIATGVFFTRGVLPLFWEGIHLRHFQIGQLLRAATSVSTSSNWFTRADNLLWFWCSWDCETLVQSVTPLNKSISSLIKFILLSAADSLGFEVKTLCVYSEMDS